VNTMRSTLSVRLFFLLALGGLAASSAVAAGPPPVAALRAGPALVEWAPLVESANTVLSISDPRGVVRTFSFAAGEAPALSLFDGAGKPLPDGTYTWEIGVRTRSGADMKQSGYFTLAAGNVVASNLPERSEDRVRRRTAQDQVVPDDLIVDGKGCIGLGCANNESFGAEVLRLKQSIVRLRFEDTSGQAGFPARDWQLTANDPGSGGADRFSLEDLTAGTTPVTVRGGAPDNSLYVTGSGFVGLGTATPQSRLHIRAADAGFGTKLIVESTGAAQPRELFELRNNGGATFIFEDTTVPERWGFGIFGANFLIDNQANTGLEYTFGNTGNLTIAGTLTQNSDRTTKTDIQRVDPRAVLSTIAALPISTWRKIGDVSTHLGPMAQDFRAAFGLGEDERSIAPGDLAGVSLAAIQGLHEVVAEQRQVIDKQQEMIGKLEERLRRLEAQEDPE